MFALGTYPGLAWYADVWYSWCPARVVGRLPSRLINADSEVQHLSVLMPVTR